MSHSEKTRLRQILRARRRSLTARQQDSAMRAACQVAQSLPEWPGARHIGLYHTADGELDTSDIAAAARAEGKQLYLPVIHPDGDLSFAQWQDKTPLLKNRVGIFEPPANAARCAIGDLDILFMPLVGWDKAGNRLGMGGGFYDRALVDISGPLRVGLAHAIQEVDTLPRQSWDIPLDIIITDRGAHRLTH